MDPAFQKSLEDAQRIGRDAMDHAFASLEVGMSHGDVNHLLETFLKDAGATFLEPPRIEFGTQTGGGFLMRHLRTSPLQAGEVVSIDLRPVVGEAPGDVADTRIFGENGRYWQYRRMAFRIFTTFMDGLGACKTERDVIRFADDCAYQRGFSLFHPVSGLITHPVTPVMAPERERLADKAAILTNRLRRITPGGDRPFTGLWSVEPRFLIEEIGFLFEEVVLVEEGKPMQVIGGKMPEAGPWLA